MRYYALAIVYGRFGASLHPKVNVPWYLLPEIVKVFGIPFSLGSPRKNMLESWGMTLAMMRQFQSETDSDITV